MTPEHKAALAAGRLRARMARSQAGISPRKRNSDFLAPEIANQRKERIRIIPEQYHGLFRKVYSGKASPRQHIKAKCLDCCCWQRVEIRLCMVVCCPLWALRPYQKDDND